MGLVVALPAGVVVVPPAGVVVVVVTVDVDLAEDGEVVVVVGLTVVVGALVVVVVEPVPVAVDVVLVGAVIGVTQPVWAGLVRPIPLLRSHS